MNQKLTWPTKEIIYFLIVIALVQLGFSSVIGDVASEIRSGYEMLIYALLDLLFVARIIKAKIKHEENKDWKVYLLVLAIASILTPIAIRALERLLI
jgi:hypothetical protein